MKTKTITLTAHEKVNPTEAEIRRDNTFLYRVEKITDFSDPEYHPGKMLTQHTVDGLCASARWKVSIVPVKVGA